MPRDDDHLDRLYDQPTRRAPAASRAGGLVYAGLLLAMLVGGVGVAALTLTAIGIGAKANADLRELGVLGPDETAIALHDHSPAADRSSGCALTPTAVVRWDDRRLTARVPLLDGKVDVVDGAVVLANGEQRVTCPFPEGEGANGFAVVIDRERKSLEAARAVGSAPPGAVDAAGAGDKGAAGAPP